MASGGLVFMAATLVGLFFTVQIYLSAASAHQSVSWGQALYWALGDWYEWALLAPLFFWICRRFRLDQPRRSLPMHVLAGIALASVHAVLCTCAAVLQGWYTHLPKSFGAELRRL